jgi:hypothetical protein
MQTGPPGDQAEAAAMDATARATAGRLGMELPGWAGRSSAPRP